LQSSLKLTSGWFTYPLHGQKITSVPASWHVTLYFVMVCDGANKMWFIDWNIWHFLKHICCTSKVTSLKFGMVGNCFRPSQQGRIILVY